MKTALKDFNPLEIVFIRFFFAFILLLPIAIIKKQLHFQKKDIPHLLLISFFFAGNVLLFVYGLQFTTSIASQLFYLLTPMLVIILSYFLLQHPIEKKHLISIAAGFAGGLVITLRSGDTALAQSLGNIKGNVIVIMAVCTWACYVVSSKKLSHKYSHLSIVVFVNAITAFLSVCLLIGMGQNILTSFTNAHFITLLNLCFLVVFNSILFFFLYQWALKLVKPFSVSLSSYIGLLATATLAIPLFGEKLTIQLLISTVLIIFSSYMTFKKR